MIFTTFRFAFFFALFYPLFRSVPRAWRGPLLLAASYFFYMSAIPWYILVIVAITLIDYFAGIRIEESRSERGRRFYLVFSIVSNVALLVAFKYGGFLADTITAATGLALPIPRLVLPIGLSFHTFQAISYTIEVYRRTCAAERSLLRYALYVAFFPQMVAGPIERPYNLLPQFQRDVAITNADVFAGLRCILWGVFKKLVVADTLAFAVDTVYADPHAFHGPILFVATFFFAIQIYCDFSGYSDMAIGLARMMGYRLMVNFRQPYLARSIPEFWKRWHISLTSWFRDYVYLPLGGRRVSVGRYYANVAVVFLLSGLWHGANWTFVVWGALHGAYYIIGRATSDWRRHVKTALKANEFPAIVGASQMVMTFGLVMIAWVFFRAASLADATYIVTHLFAWSRFDSVELFSMGLPRFELGIAVVGIVSVAVVEWCVEHKPRRIETAWRSPSFRVVCYNACLFSIICFGVLGGMKFIYFQF